MLIQIARNGHITIPKEIRDQLGLKDGDYLDAKVQDGELILLLPVDVTFTPKRKTKT